MNIQIARAVRSQGVEEMHDLRVSIRRFTGILGTFKVCFPRSDSRRIRRTAKQIMVLAGEVRNYDIAIHLITRMAVPDSPAIVQLFQRRRKEAARILLASLRRWRQRGLAAGWLDAMKSDQKPKGADRRFRALPIRVAANRIMPEKVKEYFVFGEAAADHGASAHKMHRFRIAAKNFRYTLDFLAPLYDGACDGMVEQLKSIQSLLGDINDAATTRRLVSREGGGPARKPILAALKERQRKKADEFHQQFAAESVSSSVRRQWKATVRLGPGTPGDLPAMPAATGRRRLS
jgi:CHAD domain-containing protein